MIEGLIVGCRYDDWALENWAWQLSATKGLRGQRLELEQDLTRSPL